MFQCLKQQHAYVITQSLCWNLLKLLISGRKLCKLSLWGRKKLGRYFYQFNYKPLLKPQLGAGLVQFSLFNFIAVLHCITLQYSTVQYSVLHCTTLQ